MVLYFVISNNGGMKRVFESIKDVNNIVTVVFSEIEIKGHSNVHWVDWDYSKMSDETFKKTKIRIKEIVEANKIELVISDMETLPLIEDLNLPYVFDIHSLGRPLYEAIKSNKNRLKTNALLNFPQTPVYELLMYNTLVQELKIVNNAKGLITYSKNSTHYLKEYYLKENNQIPIFEQTLSTDLPVVEEKKYTEKKYPYYIFSRWHPQKGLGNVFFENWQSGSVFIRGVNQDQFKEPSLKELNDRGIHFLPWTNNDREIAEDLEGSDIVLFPSIYEPWGLALQEALAKGCLCVAHKNNSGHEEQIANGENGFLIDMSQENWTEELKKISNLPEQEKQKIKRKASASSQLGHIKAQERVDKLLAWIKNL